MPKKDVVGRDLRLLIEGNEPGETMARRRGGEYFPVDMSIGEMHLNDQHLLVLSIRDITARKKAEAALEHQALHDTLTDLPNRVLLRERLETSRRRAATPLALLLSTWTASKRSTTPSATIGDLLLQQIGQRLRRRAARRRTRSPDSAATSSPSCCRAPTPSVPSRCRRASARRAARRRSSSTASDRGRRQHRHRRLHPTTAATPTRCCAAPTWRCTSAKRGGHGWRLYDVEQDQHSAERLALVGELRRAIERDELLLHYQPKLDLRDGALVGVEALVRWQHPATRLPAAERVHPAGRADRADPSAQPVGARRGAAPAPGLARTRACDIPVAVNLSRRTAARPAAARDGRASC